MKHTITNDWDTADTDLGMAAGPSTEIILDDGRRVAADAIWTETDGIRWFTHWSADQQQPSAEVDGLNNHSIIRYLEDEITALQTIRADILAMTPTLRRTKPKQNSGPVSVEVTGMGIF